MLPNSHFDKKDETSISAKVAMRKVGRSIHVNYVVEMNRKTCRENV